ncbi:MAG: 50S ribosomal protein L4 [Clostridia bacterium]|nr:50S ribosomal protein L4 [Clostridia bacterium]
MANFSVVDVNGKKVSDIELSDAVFAVEPNVHAMHLAVISYLANQRQGTQSTLTRSEVSGGGRKPWRQKGTGHARQGSTRSPQWTHGGIALGPKPRTYSIAINKKVKRLALVSALSAKAQENELVILDDFKLDAIKTKEVANTLSNLETGKKVLIVLPEKNDIVYRSARNIAGVKVAMTNTINVYDLLNANTVVMLKDAATKLEEVYA